MKIYFAASIMGGRQKALDYRGIVDFLKMKGEVLTEHIADIKLSDIGEHMPADKIYERDKAWIDLCDVLIAEVTVVSMGVGYEIGYAESKGKPILCLYDSGDVEKISSMICGNKNIKCKSYRNQNDLQKEVNAFLQNI